MLETITLGLSINEFHRRLVNRLEKNDTESLNLKNALHKSLLTAVDTLGETLCDNHSYFKRFSNDEERCEEQRRVKEIFKTIRARFPTTSALKSPVDLLLKGDTHSEVREFLTRLGLKNDLASLPDPLRGHFEAHLPQVTLAHFRLQVATNENLSALLQLDVTTSGFQAVQRELGIISTLVESKIQEVTDKFVTLERKIDGLSEKQIADLANTPPAERLSSSFSEVETLFGISGGTGQLQALLSLYLVVQQFINSIPSDKPLFPTAILNEPDESVQIQSPPVQIESPYGTMPPDSPFYIERQADHDCWGYLSQGHAATIFVQAPWQTGKSSLIQQMIHRAKEVHDVSTAFIDFQEFPEELLEDEEAFLIEFCLMIGDALQIPEAIDQYWSSRHRSNLVKCRRYLSEHIIPSLNKPFILAMDETQRILTSRLSNNFFGMLRVWHNKRGQDENLAKMTLLLSSSTEPHLFIDNPNQSPFNVATLILLRDFTMREVEELNRRHQSLLNQAQISDLVDLLGGHPFLTRLAFYLLAAGRIEFHTLLTTATSDSGPFENHLRRYWHQISDRPKVKRSVSDICRHQKHPKDKLYYRLKGAGLIKMVGKEVVMRNKLYARYFRERLNG